MRKYVVLPAFLLFLFFIAGCGITIVPRPLVPSDRVNPSDRSITKENNSITLSARVQDTAVGGYSLAKPLTSFYISIVNKRRTPISLQQSSFVLIDDQGKVYKTVPPATVNELLYPDFNLFQPFPYVSILNVAEQENQRAASGMASEQPYVGRGLERDPAGSPFPDLAISPGTRSSGVVFFEVDLSLFKSVRLQVTDPVDKSAYIFPFGIE